MPHHTPIPGELGSILGAGRTLVGTPVSPSSLASSLPHKDMAPGDGHGLYFTFGDAPTVLLSLRGISRGLQGLEDTLRGSSILVTS